MLIRLLKQYPVGVVIFFITAATALLSVTFTSLLLIVFQGFVDQLGVVISILAPTIIMPLPLLHFFRLILRLDETETLLNEKNRRLEDALGEVKELSGLLPICSKCKKIRDDQGYWSQIETYIEDHSNAQFSHGLCDTCIREMYARESWYKKAQKKM